MSCIKGVQDLIAWTSPSGVARALYINGPEWDETRKSVGIFARIWLALLLLVPFAIGSFELVVGIMYRHNPAGCKYPLPAWIIVDGSAALLLTLLSIIDIARVQRIARDEEDKQDDEENTPFQAQSRNTPEAREKRLSQMGTYVALGCAVIILVPLFRLIWVLFGVDLAYHIDPSSFNSLKLSDKPAIGECNELLFSFLFYYLEAVMFLLLVTAVGLIFLIIAISIQCLPPTRCSCRCCCCKEAPKKGIAALMNKNKSSGHCQ